MKGGDYQWKCYNHIACIKWYDNKFVMLLGGHLEEITSILTMQIRLDGSSSRIPVNCTNGIKLQQQNGWSWLDVDQLKSAYQLAPRSQEKDKVYCFFFSTTLKAKSLFCPIFFVQSLIFKWALYPCACKRCRSDKNAKQSENGKQTFFERS